MRSHMHTYVSAYVRLTYATQICAPYILEWMLMSSIPHVDGACIWLPYFDIALYICLSIFTRLKRYYYFLNSHRLVKSGMYILKTHQIIIVTAKRFVGDICHAPDVPKRLLRCDDNWVRSEAIECSE